MPISDSPTTPPKRGGRCLFFPYRHNYSLFDFLIWIGSVPVYTLATFFINWRILFSHGVKGGGGGKSCRKSVGILLKSLSMRFICIFFHFSYHLTSIPTHLIKDCQFYSSERQIGYCPSFCDSHLHTYRFSHVFDTKHLIFSPQQIGCRSLILRQQSTHPSVVQPCFRHKTLHIFPPPPVDGFCIR